MLVKRYDRLTIDKIEVTRQGFLRIKFRGGRTGVLDYGDHKEFRSLDELKSETFQKTFKSAPLTDGHPVDEFGSPVFVTKDNSRELMRGFTADKIGFVEIDGETFVEGDATITDAELIKKIMDDGVREISAGYSLDLEQKDGVHKGEAFQFAQRVINNNHFAILDAGRAGPNAALIMDGELNQVWKFKDGAQPSPFNGDTTMKVTIDGVEYDVKDQAQADALKASFKKQEDANKKSKEDMTAVDVAREAQKKAEDERDEAKGKADAAAKAQEKATDQKSIDAMVETRSELMDSAKKMLPEDKQDEIVGLSNLDIKKFVITALDKDAELKDESEAYIDGVYSQMVKSDTTKTDGGSGGGAGDLGESIAAARATDASKASDGKPGEGVIVDKKEIFGKDAYAHAQVQLKDAWKNPVGRQAS